MQSQRQTWTSTGGINLLASPSVGYTFGRRTSTAPVYTTGHSCPRSHSVGGVFSRSTLSPTRSRSQVWPLSLELLKALLRRYSRSSACVRADLTVTWCSNTDVNKGIEGDDQSAS